MNPWCELNSLELGVNSTQGGLPRTTWTVSTELILYASAKARLGAEMKLSRLMLLLATVFNGETFHSIY